MKLIQGDLDRASILRIPIYTLGGDRIRMNDNVYDLTPEKNIALSSTSYTGDTMKDENDILSVNNIKGDLGYTGVGEKPSKQKTLLTMKVPKLVEEFQNKTFAENMDNSDDDLGGRRLEKFIIPSNIIDIYTRFENLRGQKLSGHTNTLTEASNLIDELYKRGELQIEQQYRNAPNKFSTE